MATVVDFAAARSASAFGTVDRWERTASGLTGQAGDPITLTWGFVGDGTQTLSEGPSELISVFDATFGGAPADTDVDDLTLRPWFDYFDSSFRRWEAISGITFLYEEDDDGATLGSSSSYSRGRLSTRADLRMAGAAVDGAGSVLAYAYLPDNGDIVFDTNDMGYFSNGFGEHLQLRNTIMHEVGHSIGLNHVNSSNANFLLEPAIRTTFEGPQFDDIRAVQSLYGDFYEKANNGLGNDTFGTSVSLDSLLPGGNLGPGDAISLGTSAAATSVGSSDIDFLSIDRDTDIDFFSFSVSEASLIDLVLTPLGPTYFSGPEGGTQTTINTSLLSDLSLAVFDTNGFSLLDSINATGAGSAESLLDLSLPSAGEYFVRVTGDSSDLQFYQLDLSRPAEAVFLATDFNEDSYVDDVDFGLWEASFGIDGGADSDADGDTDGFDFLHWQRQFAGGPVVLGASQLAVPEPSTALLAIFAVLGSCFRRKL